MTSSAIRATLGAIFALVTIPGCTDSDEPGRSAAAGGRVPTSSPDAAVTVASGGAVRDTAVEALFDASLRGTVWVDSDDDGERGRYEGALGGIDVVVSGPGPDGIAGTDDDQSRATTTRAGAWEVSRLAPGRYVVDVDVGSLPPGGRAVTPHPRRVDLRDHQRVEALDFGVLADGLIAHQPPTSVKPGAVLPIFFNYVCEAGLTCRATVWYRTTPAGTDGNGEVVLGTPGWTQAHVRKLSTTVPGSSRVRITFATDIPGHATGPGGVDYLIKVTEGPRATYWPNVPVPAEPSDAYPLVAHHVGPAS